MLSSPQCAQGSLGERSMSSCSPGPMDEVSPPLAPSQRCEQETTSAGMQGDGTRPGTMDEVSPPLAPSQRCEQGTTFAGMTGRRHEAGHHGRSFPSSRSQSGMRAGDDIRWDDRATARGRAPWIGSPPLAPSQGREQEMTMVVPAGSGPRKLGTGTTESEECIRPGRPSEGSPVNSFPRIELGAPP